MCKTGEHAQPVKERNAQVQLLLLLLSFRWERASWTPVTYQPLPLLPLSSPNEVHAWRPVVLAEFNCWAGDQWQAHSLHAQLPKACCSS